MAEKYVFRDDDTNELIYEIFNNDERLESREYKTIRLLDEREPISVEQAHLIMHVFFVDTEASLAEKIKMVAEVLLAGSELGNDYPEADVLNKKISEVKLSFDANSSIEETQH